MRTKLRLRWHGRLILFVLLSYCQLLVGCFDSSSQKYRFAVIGDFGCNNANEADVAKLVNSWGPEFIVTVGDNNYPVGAASTIDANIGQYFHEYIFPYKGKYGIGAPLHNRFHPVLGNHDWDLDPQPYFDYFSKSYNQRYYDFVRGQVQFFMLNSNETEPDGRKADSIQAEWLRSRVADSKSSFKLVFMHHPPYSSFSTHSSERDMQWPYSKWGVTAVLAGHNHFYERLNVDGVTYFINGLGGQDLYPITSVHPASQFTYTMDYGAQLVEVDQDQIAFSFINVKGELQDKFILKPNG